MTTIETIQAILDSDNTVNRVTAIELIAFRLREAIRMTSNPVSNAMDDRVELRRAAFDVLDIIERIK